MSKSRRKSKSKAGTAKPSKRPQQQDASRGLSTLGELLATKGGLAKLDAAKTKSRAQGPERSEPAAPVKPSAAPTAAPQVEPLEQPEGELPEVSDPKEIMAALDRELAEKGVALIDKFKGAGEEPRSIRIVDRASGRSSGERHAAAGGDAAEDKPRRPEALTEEEVLKLDMLRAFSGVQPLPSGKSRVPGKIPSEGYAPAEAKRGATAEMTAAYWLQPNPYLTVEQRQLADEPWMPRIDLHGMSGDDALNAAKGFVNKSRVRGDLSVVIVCGKGRTGLSVLREVLLGWLLVFDHPSVSKWAPKLDQDGHWGSLILRLRPWQ